MGKLTALLWCLLMIVPSLGLAQGSYSQLSLGVTALRGETVAADLSFVEPASVWKGAKWMESLTMIAPSRYYDDKARTNAILSGLIVRPIGDFDIGVGVSYVGDPSPYNGENFNFALLAAYNFKRWPLTLSYKHWSDAGMTGSNIGRDLVTIGYKFN